MRKQLHVRYFPREEPYLGVSSVHASQSYSPHSSSQLQREFSVHSHERCYQDTKPNRGRKARSVLLPGHAGRRGRGRQHRACAPALVGSGVSGLLLIPPGSIFVSQQSIKQIIKDMEILEAKNPAATPDSSSEDEHSPLADAKCIYPGAGQGKPRCTMKAGGKTV